MMSLQREEMRNKDKSFKKDKRKDMTFFLCNEPHLVSNFLKRKALSAMMKISSKKGSVKGSSSKSEVEGHLSSLQLLKVVSKKNVKMEESSR